MHRDSPVLGTRSLARVVTPLLLSTCLLAKSVPAFADENASSTASGARTDAAEPHLGTNGKIVVYSFSGVSVASAIAFAISLAARESAVSRHNRFPTIDGFTDCATPQDCDELASARRSADAWGTVALVSGALAVTTGISALVFALVWPRETSSARARVAPSVSTTGASVAIEGRF